MSSSRSGGSPEPSWLRTATSARMVLLLVLLLGAAAVCARLGVWQLDRAQARGGATDAAAIEAVLAADPEPLDQVLAPQSPFPGELVGDKVHVTGRFEADELLVPGRVLDGRIGFLVLSPLRVDVAGEPVLAVVRGWVPDEATGRAVQPAPSGPVEVTGFLQSGEAGSSAGLPQGQVDAVSPAELVNRWGGPAYSGYLVLHEVDPAQDPAIALMPVPTLAGGGLNVQNLAYALQWWIFGGFAVLLWVRMVRDETRAQREELAEAADVDLAGASSSAPQPLSPPAGVGADRP